MVNDEVPPTTKDCLMLVFEIISQLAAVVSAKTAAFAVVPVIICQD